MDKDFNLIEALRTILKWKSHILILTVSSGIIAGLVSVFVMDEWYFSWSTLYPTSQNLSARSAIFNGDPVDYFGGKSDVNRVLSIATSNPIIDFVIDSFHMADHYKIEKAGKYWRTKVRKKFDKNYDVKKTEHDAIEISLYDTDPKLAAEIVNTVVKRIDRMNNFLMSQTKEKTFGSVDLLIGKIQNDVANYNDSLARLGKDYNIKVAVGTDGTVIIDGKDYAAVQSYRTLFSKQANATRELNNVMNIKGQLDVSMKKDEPSLFVLETAIPAERREKPVRSLVVLVTMLITFFVSVIGVLGIEQINEIKKQL